MFVSLGTSMSNAGPVQKKENHALSNHSFATRPVVLFRSVWNAEISYARCIYQFQQNSCSRNNNNNSHFACIWNLTI